MERKPPKDWDEFFKRVTYKKGYSFHYQFDIDFNRHRLLIEVICPDSYHPEKEIRVMHRFWLEPWHGAGLKGALNMLRMCIHQVETHEADEFFRFDGDVAFDPHAHERR